MAEGKAVERGGEPDGRVALLADEQVGGRFGVGEGAVRPPGLGQGMPGAQGAEPMVRGLRMQPARQQQGAGEAMGVVGRALRALGLRVPEAAVERGVVGDERDAR